MARKDLEKKIFWNVLRRVYKILATDEGQKIVKTLLVDSPMRSTVLLKRTGLSESQFHPIMKELVKCMIVEKTVGEDRGVTYSIDPFGKNVLDLSKPLLAKVKKEIAPELLQNF